MNIFNKICKKIKRYNNISKTSYELSRLSDRELSDIGITRYDIRSIASESTK